MKEKQGRIHDNTVAGGLAGAVMSWAGAYMSRAGAEMIWAGALRSMKYSYLNFSTFKLLNNAKKVKCDGPTDGRTDRHGDL